MTFVAILLAGSLLSPLASIAVEDNTPKEAADKAQVLSRTGEIYLRRNNPDRAIYFFDKSIEINPKTPTVFMSRGLAWLRKGDTGKAIRDFDESIKLDPKIDIAFYYRGRACYQAGKKDQALADFDKAIQLNPSYVEALNSRGVIWADRCDCGKAIDEYSKAIRIDPKYLTAINNRAWAYAGCPDPKCRDGKKALADATRACEVTNWKDPYQWAILAAAYAELDDFDSAVKWQKKAMEDKDYARTDGDEGKNNFELYVNKKPWRDPRKCDK